jgi:hypothetical protein
MHHAEARMRRRAVSRQADRLEYKAVQQVAQQLLKLPRHRGGGMT